MASLVSRERPDASITRVTKGGRKLTYGLTVIQQPERARACGSGAKSSADRRPVDPPPVVELRIFEGDGPDKTDITFGYDANFFLFATLEMARPIAHGRLPPPTPTPLVPVLTGMPVSGMAYLDRPTEAGYFIFPDLSVRHEGRYRLSFNLYEETKDAKDDDAAAPGPPPRAAVPPVPGAAPAASFDWRLEVRSAVFTVFSAKKFPGLAESTVLSRTVAEQGCRVRIRRDVRMRRRDGKPNSEYEDPAEEYARAARPPSVHDAYRERTRSLSSESADRRAYPELGRRMSGEYGAQPARPSYLGFGGSQYRVPQPIFAQPAPPQPAPLPQAPYHAVPAHPHPGPQFRQPAPPPQPGYSRPPHPHAAYPPPSYAQPAPAPSHARPPSYGRQSISAGSPSGANPPYPLVDANHGAAPGVPCPAVDPYRSRPASRDSSRTYSSPPAANKIQLPPIKSFEPRPETRCVTSSHVSLPSLNTMSLPPPQAPDSESARLRVDSFMNPPSTLPSLDALRKTKRDHDAAFPALAASHTPLFNGMRPSTDHGDLGISEHDDDRLTPDLLSINYRRADGSSSGRSTNIAAHHSFALH